MAISTVLLAYQEAENLKLLLPKIKKELDTLPEEYEIIVVDTAKKTDNTDEVCAKFGAKYINQRYEGFGGAFRTGIECAHYDKFLILDSDGSHNPIYIPDIYRKMTKGVDLVIGSRYTKGGSTNDSTISIIMSKCLNTVFRLFFGIKAKDISTDYRMYRTAQLKKVSLECRNYDVLEEVLIKLKKQKKNFTIAEVPITFHKRMYGESKRKLLPFIASYLKTLFRLLPYRFEKDKGKKA